MPRKVLMIAPTSFFSDYGGHIRILEETLALQARYHQITIVTYYKGRDLPDLDIRRTAPLPYRTDYEVGSSRHKVAFDIYLAWTALVVALRERPDIIHGHMHEGALIGWVISKVVGVPLVFDYQGSLTAEMVDHNFLHESSLLFRLVRRFERFIDHRSKIILTSSQQARTQLQDVFHMPAARIQPLPDCVDLKRFDRSRFTDQQLIAVRDRYDIPATSYVIGYLGLLTDYQGIPHLLQAAVHLKSRGEPVRFLIMGFPNVPHYRRMAVDLGVDELVTFTGKIPYDDAPLFLAATDVAITAKVSATEGSGKLLNYMALEMPVIAYDTPVHREYLGEHGFYVTPGNIGGLADAIQTLGRSPDQREEIGRCLHQHVAQNFTWAQAAVEIEDAYERLLIE